MGFLRIVPLHCGPSATTMHTQGFSNFLKCMYYSYKSYNNGINSSRYKGKMNYFSLHANVYL